MNYTFEEIVLFASSLINELEQPDSEDEYIDHFIKVIWKRYTLENWNQMLEKRVSLLDELNHKLNGFWDEDYLKFLKDVLIFIYYYMFWRNKWTIFPNDEPDDWYYRILNFLWNYVRNAEKDTPLNKFYIEKAEEAYNWCVIKNNETNWWMLEWQEKQKMYLERLKYWRSTKENWYDDL